MGPFGEGLTYTIISYREKQFKGIEQNLHWNSVNKKTEKDVKEFERVANSFPNVKKANVFKVHPIPLDEYIRYGIWKSKEGHITVLINPKKQEFYILEMAAD